jgi:hypothetical protein
MEVLDDLNAEVAEGMHAEKSAETTSNKNFAPVFAPPASLRFNNGCYFQAAIITPMIVKATTL